ncbi:MAG: 2-hydroxyacyl-CoA dehydratase family protein [Proteobacteria bacterium]|nr:2-hydroxyacyl-CoA dehydratase family protein [Pseudomonadota bacterium]
MDEIIKEPNRLESVSKIGAMMIASFLEIKEQAARGSKVVWANGLPAFLLARGAGLPVLHAEGLIAGLAAKGLEKPLQEAAEEFGMLPDCCSYARSFIGLARIARGDFALNPDLDPTLYRMPPPDLYVNVPGAGCGTGRLWGDSVAAICGVPAFHLEPRFNWDESDQAYNFEDYIRQQKQFIGLLEEVTGRPYDWDRLREVMGHVKKAVTLRQEIMDLCAHKPSPASFFDMAANIGPVCHLVGLPGTVGLLDDMKQEVEQRIAQGVGSVPNERYRLYWDGIMTWPKLGVLGRKFASLDACVVAGAYTHLLFMPRADLIDPDRPLESIAHNLCGIGINCDFNGQVDHIVNLCEKFGIDGLVMSETQTCRAFNSHSFAVMDGVGRRLGIPAVTIGGDSCDERFYSDAQTDTRLQALVETIEARRKNRLR